MNKFNYLQIVLETIYKIRVKSKDDIDQNDNMDYILLVSSNQDINFIE